MQNKLLLRIIRANGTSDFGRRHNFASIGSYEDFAQSLPIANYGYFAPYIDRCRRGEASALFGPSQKVLMFSLTSGTTSAAKYIPVTAEFAQSYRNGWNIWGVKALTDHPAGYLRKILQVTSSAQEFLSEGGIPCGAISGMLAREQKFIVRRYYVTPPEVADIPDATARYYTIMRLAVPEDIGFISTANPSTTVTLARTAERYAGGLIRDLRDGTLSNTMDIPQAIRAKLSGRLRRHRARAAELEDLLSRHGRLLPQHYWNLAFLANWTGGTLSLYLPQLAEYYGPTPIRDIGLLASEGRITICTEDNTPAGILDIGANFYEFIPAEQYDALDDADADTLGPGGETILADQLQVGEEYYILLTNYAGLYRYNLGDRIRVIDFRDSTPVIEFLSKGAHTSSITGEKLTEKQIVDAVRTAANELLVDMTNFIVAPIFCDLPHYRLYFEANKAIESAMIEVISQCIDQRLALTNIEYQSKRKSQRLGPLDVQQLPGDFLAKRDQVQIQKNQGRAEQFKHRFLYNTPAVF